MTFHQTIERGTHPGYPRRLAKVSDPPERLHVRGKLEEPEHAVAIVGARAARTGDMEIAHELARALAERGVLVVSGGALGIDSAAHRGALAGSPADRARTVAVLGCGLDVAYPERNRDLFAEIVARGGALLSQFDRNAPPRPWQFPLRNATIAGMVDAVVVVGAGAHSGALYTAKYAREYGRLVAAVPGTAGCDALLASGAAVVREVADLEAAWAGSPVGLEVDLPCASTPKGQVLAWLDASEPQDADEISLGTGLMIREVHRALTSLELDGLAVPRPGQSYLRSRLAQALLGR